MIQIKVLIINRNRKNFSFIKSLRTEHSGVVRLKKEGQLVADTKQKANILNEQFQSVFTTESIDNMSSANSLGWLDFKYSGKSFIYTKRRTGPELFHVGHQK
jgi:hypothetical protein